MTAGPGGAEAQSDRPRPQFVGVGIDTYEHFEPLEALAGVDAVATLLSAGRDFESTVYRDVDDAEAEAQLSEALAPRSLPGGLLLVLWAGHGEAARLGGLRLITRKAAPQLTATRTAAWLAELAIATGASQLLLVFDTCYSGQAVIDAAEVAARLNDILPEPKPAWVGILTSAQPYERARDGVFSAELRRVLSDGPVDPVLRLRFNCFNAGVRGDDVIDAIVQEWGTSSHRPHAMTQGRPSVLLPNPLYDPDAPERVVEHLLLAAQGRGPDEKGLFFTGREEQLDEIVAWMARPDPGVLVVTGPAGSGKTAIAGRIVSLSNPAEREVLLRSGPVGPDPGEGSVHAHVHVRRLTVDRVAALIDDQLRRRGVLPPAAEDRNAHELLGALERLDRPVTIVLDGVDEAEADAWPIADDLVRGLGRIARVLVATRELDRDGAEPLVASLATLPVINLGERRWADQTESDVRRYVDRRLGDVDGSMDAVLVADRIVGLAADSREGLFLLARVITGQLRTDPVNTSASGWEHALATSVEAAFDRDLGRVTGAAPNGRDGPAAVRDLMTALAWGYGAGLPDDAWAAIATALSAGGPAYSVADVYWALAAASRYVVAADGGGRAAYRLSHQRLAQHVRPPRALVAQLDRDPEASAVAGAIKGLFDAVVAAGTGPAGHHYLWLYAWRHCADAGPAGIGHLRSMAADSPAFVPDLAAALNYLGIRYSAVGRRAEAVAPAEEAVALRRELAAASPAFVPDLASALNNVGIRYSEVGRRAEAVAPTEEAVALYRELAAANPAFAPDLASALNSLGNRYSRVGRRAEAVAPTEEAVALYRELAAANPAFVPDLASALNNVGIRYSEVGRRAEAVAPTEEAVALYRELAAANPAFAPDLASALNSLGNRYSRVGRRAEAVAPTEEAVALRRELAAANPAFVPDLAGALNNLGIRYGDVGRRAEAVAPTEEAVALYRELAAANPAFVPDLASALNNLGACYGDVGRRAEAVLPTEEAVALYRELAAANPAFVPDLASALNNVGIRYSEVGRRAEAVAPTEEAVALYRELAAANPAFAPDLASALNNLGNRYSRVGRRAEAVAPTEEAVALRRELAAANPAFVPDLASALNNLGIRYSDVGRRAEAVAPTEQAVALYRELAAANPAFVPDLASALNNLGIRYSDVGRRAEAVAPTEEAVALRRELAAANPAFAPGLAMALNNLGTCYNGVGRRAEAVAPTEEAVALYRELAADNHAFVPDLAMALNNVGTCYSEVGRRAEAVAPTEEAVALYRELAADNPAFVPDLATALSNLGTCYREVGRRAADIDAAWERAMEVVALPTSRFQLVLARAASRVAVADAVSDLVAANALAAGESELQGRLHQSARELRAQAPADFDVAWRASEREVPEWLTLDVAHLELVLRWVLTPTYAEAAELAGEHSAALVEGPTDLALIEVALLGGDPSAVADERAILAAARREGFAATYKPLLRAEFVRSFLGADVATQLRLLGEHRERLLEIDPEEVGRRVDAAEVSQVLGAALLALARVGLDQRAAAAAGSVGELTALADGLIRSGDAGPLLALSQLAAIQATTADIVAVALFLAAVALTLSEQVEEGAKLLQAARRSDEAAVAALVPRLLAWTGTRPELSALAGALAASLDPLTREEEE